VLRSGRAFGQPVELAAEIIEALLDRRDPFPLRLRLVMGGRNALRRRRRRVDALHGGVTEDDRIEPLAD
jgi:hypothetical protein